MSIHSLGGIGFLLGDVMRCYSSDVPGPLMATGGSSWMTNNLLLAPCTGRRQKCAHSARPYSTRLQFSNVTWRNASCKDVVLSKTPSGLAWDLY